jgi:riboflavin kinase/FMN adenylyltransferase
MPFRVIRNGAPVPDDFGPCSLTIGNFDGVHAGHRELMKRVVYATRRNTMRATVVTFDPHPSTLVAPHRVPHLLTTMDQRLSLIQSEQISQVLVLPFTAEIAKLSPEEFVKNLLVDHLKARHVVVGDNFRFGAKQAGDADLLAQLGEKYGFRTDAVKAVKMGKLVVSSSEIRKQIATGSIALANRMLQRPYSLEGRVVAGHGVGAKQTVPTLNLETRAEIIPAPGVYVTRTWDVNSLRNWNSISNIGYRPTFGGGDKLSIETFLLSEFDGTAPAEIRVEFLQWVREERKFDSPELLKAQIFRDVGKAKAYFSRADSML